MTAGLQLALAFDPLRDDLSAGERAAVEARIQDDDHRRALHAMPAQRCRCRRPWPMGDNRCVRCGREVRRP